MSKTVLVIFGTRPEAIKLAPVVLALKQQGFFKVKVCVTGQHREMLDQVLQLFNVVPDFDLNLMKPGQTLTEITSSALQGLDSVLEQVRPDIVVVQGDTTTTLTASLAAYYRQIDVAHVEAGLRSGNLLSPWPEEGNRKLTTQLARFHFAPTAMARRNLLDEGVPDEWISVTGNTVIDALLRTMQGIRDDQHKLQDISGQFSFLRSAARTVLITAHRRESFGVGMQNIVEAVKTLATSYADDDFVFPVHMNPKVQKPVFAGLSDLVNVHLIEPLDYAPFVYLMDRSYVILTDSGGVQEEAPSLGKPVIVMRDVTERMEAVEAGTVVLAGTEKNSIVDHAVRLLTNTNHYLKMSEALNPYGDGKASEGIASVLHAAYS